MERVLEMKRSILGCLMIVAVFCHAGKISVSDVVIVQDSASRIVTVKYTLGETPAIVTVDFMTNCVSVVSEDPFVTVTNAVSIGEENFTNVKGDVNRLVTGAGTHTITWQPMDSWPDRALGKGAIVASVTARAKDDPPDYMVASLGEENIPAIAYYVSTNALPDGGLTNDAYRTSRLLMRRIKATGVRWQMGASADDYENAGLDDKPTALETAHGVTLSYDYFMGVYPVTQEQYRRFTGAARLGGYYTNYVDSAIRPRSGVNYDNLRGSGTGTGHSVGNSSAIKKLRNFTGIDFDLPSDAEWEFACKAGTTGLLYTGAAFTSANVNKLGWVWGNSLYSDINERQTHAVGQKLPNAWGLYDMIGNTWEWCRDKCIGEVNENGTKVVYMNLGSEEVVDPVGNTGSRRVMRGVRFNYSYEYGRTSYRANDVPNRGNDQTQGYGFRVMCPVTLKFE